MKTGDRFKVVPCVNCGSRVENHRGLVITSVTHKGHLFGEDLRVVTCEVCGLVFLNPQPTGESLGRFYEHEYYQGKRVSVESRLRKTDWQGKILYPWLEESLGPIRGWQILDIGCGYGEWLRFFDPSNKVMGIEQSRQAAEAANERFGVEVHQSDFMQNALAEGSVDLVTGLAIIEHFNDPLAALVEANRLLKPGGFVYLQTPDIFGLVLRKGVEAFFKLVHTYYFSLATLSSLYKKAGFEVVAARRRPAVLSTSDTLRPGNFWAGELDIIGRKVRSVSLDDARRRSGVGDRAQDIFAAYQAAWKRDEAFAGVSKRYQRPIIGPVSKVVTQLKYVATGRSIRRRDFHEEQMAMLSGDDTEGYNSRSNPLKPTSERGDAHPTH